MPPQSKRAFERSLKRAVRALDGRGVVFLRQDELDELLKETGLSGAPHRNVTNELLKKEMLMEMVFSTGRGEVCRYAWRILPSPFSIATALLPGGHLSHGSALALHGIGPSSPSILYVNKEQSPKPHPTGGLTQESIDHAFARPQRTSGTRFTYADRTYVLLNRKHTAELGVTTRIDPDSGRELRVTDIERTLIDIAVRPAYAGGAHGVAAAFQAARPFVDVGQLVGYLKRLDYVYPYHQSIGFYLARTGHPQAHLLREPGLRYDFYLDYAMEEPVLDPKWRVFIPRDFDAARELK